MIDTLIIGYLSLIFETGGYLPAPVTALMLKLDVHTARI